MACPVRSTSLLDDLLGRCSFPAPGTRVVCAVSGGADSLALLALAVHAGCEVAAFHVDHGLRSRAEHDAERETVRAAADRLGAAFDCVSVNVPAGANLEARARDARRHALPPEAMTGHTADDVAETVLLNLMRGAGLRGLAGIRPGPTKPILRLRRDETHRLCAELGLAPAHDPTNDSPAFRRNRVRHELLPLLDAIAERDVANVIARQADQLRDDSDLLDELASAIDPTDARALSAAPRALARRAVRRWLIAELRLEHPPDLATVERVLEVARTDARACDVAQGARVTRSGMRLALHGA